MNKTYASNFAFHFTQPDKDGLIIFAVDFRQLISIGTFSKRKKPSTEPSVEFSYCI